MVTHAATNLVRPMVSYRALAVGVEPASLGLLSAAFSIVPLAVALQLGRIVDRGGERIFILGGTVLMIIAALSLAAADSAAWVFLLFAMQGLGHLTMVIASQGMIARGSNERNYDRRFAALAVSASLGQLVGPAIAGLVAGQGSPEETTRALLVGGALSACGLPIILAIRAPAVRRQAASRGGAEAPARPSLLSIMRTPGMIRAIVVSTTVLSAVDILIIYMPALGEERHWPASLVGALLAIRAGASMASRFALSRLAGRLGRRLLLTSSMGLSALALLAIPWVPDVAPTALLMVAAGAGLGIGQPVTMSWVASLAESGARATALSVRLMGNRVGQVALPIAAGAMAVFAGAGGVLAATGLIVAISLAGVYGGLSGGVAGGPSGGQSGGRSLAPAVGVPGGTGRTG